MNIILYNVIHKTPLYVFSVLWVLNFLANIGLAITKQINPYLEEKGLWKRKDFTRYPRF